MIVDDLIENRQVLKRQLAAGAFGLAGESGWGPEAISIARECRPDLIMVGIEEPVARPLKTLEALSMVNRFAPTVAVSTLNERDYLRRAMVAGARDYIVRPVSSDDLRQILVDVLEVERRKLQIVGDMAAETGHRGEIIVVFGAKGGIGRTTLATNLAVSLAVAAGQRVALVDLDTHLGDVSLLLDLPPERTIADLIPQVHKLDPELVRTYLTIHDSGVRVLPAPLRPEHGELVAPAHVRRILETLQRTFDYVVVDTPRNFHDNVITAMDISTKILLVTALDVACLKGTRLCLDMMKAWRYPTEKVKLVVNHAHRGDEARSREAEAALDYPIFWKVPNDGVVYTASRSGRPFAQAQPRSRISKNVANLSRAISGVRQVPTGLFGRLRRG